MFVGLHINQENEIRKLYLEMYGLLMGYARSILQDYALAEEAVQETFRIACSKPDNLLTSENPKGWLINTLKNVLRNTRRSKAKTNTLLAALLQSDQWKVDGSYDEIGVDVLYSNVSEDKDFQLIKKIVLEQRTMLEAANELGITVEACTKRFQRAKKSLRKKLSENEK